MGLFDFLRSKKRKVPSLGNPNTSIGTWVNSLFANRTSLRAQEMQLEEAIQLIAIYACNKVLSESMASMQVEVKEIKQNGDIVDAVNHPIYKLVKHGFSLYSWNTFIETGQFHVGVTGNVTAKIVEDEKGRIVDLILIDSRRCKGPELVHGELVYDFGENLKLKSEEILHIPNLGFSGFWGYSPLHVAAETINVGLDAQTYSSSLFSNGGSLQGYLKHPLELDDKSAERLSKSWNASSSGPMNAGRIPVLEQGVEFVPLSLSPVDMRLTEQSERVVEDIARLYRVPPHMIQSLSKSSFNNIETQSLEFVMHTLRPWAKRWEAEMNRKLFTKREQSKYFIKFNIDSLLRGDSKSRADYLNKLYMMGVLSPNEIRDILGLNPVKDGDHYLHQGAMMPIDKILEREKMNTLETLDKIQNISDEGGEENTGEED